MCEGWLCIHKSVCNSVTEVPWMCFKMSFKLQLFATVNPFVILATIKKTFDIYCLGEVPLCLLCQGEINHSVPGGTPAGIQTDCAIWPYVGIDYAYPHSCPSIFKLIPSVSKRLLSKGNKQMMATPSWAKHTVVSVFVTGCFTLIGVRFGIWYRKGEKN